MNVPRIGMPGTGITIGADHNDLPSGPPAQSSGSGRKVPSLFEEIADHTPVDFYMAPGLKPTDASDAYRELAKKHVEHVTLVLGGGPIGEPGSPTPVLAEAMALIKAFLDFYKTVTVVAPQGTTSALQLRMQNGEKHVYREFGELGRMFVHDEGEAYAAVKSTRRFPTEAVLGMGLSGDVRAATKQVVINNQQGWEGTNGTVPQMPIRQVLDELHGNGEHVDLKLGAVISADSGMGGVKGLHTQSRTIAVRSKFRTVGAAAGDQENSPFGQFKTRTDISLKDVVKALIETAEEMMSKEFMTEILRELDTADEHAPGLTWRPRVAVNCNTANTALGEQHRKAVVNLIANTAVDIVKKGGEHPAVLGTPVTADDSAYPVAVESVSRAVLGRTIRPHMVGAHKDLAAMFDRGAHLPSHPEHEAYLALIKEAVAQLPDDTTTVWSCCTHYELGRPDWEKAIREEWEKRKAAGRNVGPVPEFIDPMSGEHTEAIIADLYTARSLPSLPDMGDRANELITPTVIISGRKPGAKQVAEQIWGGPVDFFEGGSFGRGNYPMEPVRAAIASRIRGLYEQERRQDDEAPGVRRTRDRDADAGPGGLHPGMQ